MALRVVILVPRRADQGRRDELWAFTRSWLTEHHPDFEIVEGESPEGPFNRGAAINRAARSAGAWDVAIVHDGDNIVAPRRLTAAVEDAHLTGLATVAHDTYMYLDRESSDEILEHPRGPWWPRPQIDNVDTRYDPYIIHKHVSGVVVVPRVAWDATGGFAELTGWGSEDSLFLVLCNAFGGGVEWSRGTALHLWHEHAEADTTRVIRHRNKEILSIAKKFELRGELVKLRAYLKTLGHPIPE